MNFDNIFYDTQFPCNQWNSYDRKGEPQMFASSYGAIIGIGIYRLLSNNTKVIDANSMNTIYQAFFHVMSASYLYERNQDRKNLGFGSAQGFYLNLSLNNAI